MKKVYPERSRRVAVGLSGGVDSAVSAHLLKKQGFDVSCMYLNCYDDDAPGCRGDNDRKDALAVAMHLGLPFQVLDFRKEYQTAVIGYFKKEYLAGRTPNPDVVCNRDIKFGLFLDWCIKNSFDYLATGHYADVAEILPEQNFAATPAPAEKRATSRERIVHEVGEWQAKAGATILRIPKDKHKDQTYFLWAVPRQNFSRIIFPLADITKKDVRSVAKLSKIPVADKPDSTGICFIGEVRVEDFLKRLGVKEKIGEVVTTSGQVIGRHRGVWFYTIGQRHGFSTDLWSSKNDHPPLYVIAKDVRRNRLVVGFGAETYRSQFMVSDTNWLIPNTEYRIPNGKYRILNTEYRMTHSEFSIQNSVFKNCFVRLRHLGDLIPCSLSVNSQQLTVNGDSPLTVHDSLLSVHRSRFTAHLRFAQRGIAPGQSAVFYSKDGLVLGGGVIQ